MIIVRRKLIYRALICMCAVGLYVTYKLSYYLIWGRYGSDFLSEIVIFSRDQKLQKDAHTLLRNQVQQMNPSSPVINPHPYKLLINEPNKCHNEDGSSKFIFLLVLVLTTHSKVQLRKTVRDTWASPSQIDGQNIVTLFLLGKPSEQIHTEYQSVVEQESALYHDIIMADFQDSYNNLTLKTIMGMKWVSQFCPHVKYVMKTDDDMIVMYENLVRFLSSASTPRTNFVSCNVIRAKPIRIVGSKLRVPQSVYPGDWYPPFCSGSGYVVSGDVAVNVFTVSLHTPFLCLEDVYMGLCLFQLGVTPSAHRQFYNYKVDYSDCRFKRLFTTHYKDASSSLRYNVWKKVEESKHTHCNFYFW